MNIRKEYLCIILYLVGQRLEKEKQIECESITCYIREQIKENSSVVKDYF